MAVWLNGQMIFGFTVEKNELPRSGGKPYYQMPTGGGILVVHTTEGSNVAGAIATLASKFDGPHFVVGENRIIQGRPLGVQGGSLHAPENQYPVVQVEAVGFSQTHLYSLPDSTHRPLTAVIAWAVKNLGVPLQRPSALWKDDCSDMALPWAANNKRRQSGTWPHVKGIYGHVEVANQGPSWHYDPGCLSYTKLFQDVKALLAGPVTNGIPASLVTHGV